MKKALQDIKQQIKTMMHQSESLKEVKALLRLSDEIDNVLQLLPENRPAPATAKAPAGRSRPAGSRTSAASGKAAGSSQALSGAAAATAKAPAVSAPAPAKPAATPSGRKKKETFIDPGDRE